MELRWNKFVNAFLTNEGYKNVIKGFEATAKIALFGFIIGIIIGIIVALLNIAGKRSNKVKIFSTIAQVYVTFFRGTPIIVQLLLGHFALFPLIGLNLSSITEAILIFGLNSGAYVSEIIRSGINSVDIGQLEAGRAVGLSFSVTMRKIVLPQAIKNSLPSLGNELIAIVKDTSVASLVAVTDLTNAFKLLSGGVEYLIPYMMLALSYLIIVLVLTLIIKILERRLSKSDRRN